MNAKYQRASLNYDLVQKAYDVIGTPDADGCYPCRVKYDKAGEGRRDRMEDVSE